MEGRDYPTLLQNIWNENETETEGALCGAYCCAPVLMRPSRTLAWFRCVSQSSQWFWINTELYDLICRDCFAHTSRTPHPMLSWLMQFRNSNGLFHMLGRMRERSAGSRHMLVAALVSFQGKHMAVVWKTGLWELEQILISYSSLAGNGKFRRTFFLFIRNFPWIN